MVERLVRIQEVSGSNPLISTIDKDRQYLCDTACLYHLYRSVVISGFEGDRASSSSAVLGRHIRLVCPDLV